jgi:hypothetical protein
MAFSHVVVGSILERDVDNKKNKTDVKSSISDAKHIKAGQFLEKVAKDLSNKDIRDAKTVHEWLKYTKELEEGTQTGTAQKEVNKIKLA